jgi:hypothetical protein
MSSETSNPCIALIPNPNQSQIGASISSNLSQTPITFMVRPPWAFRLRGLSPQIYLLLPSPTPHLRIARRLKDHHDTFDDPVTGEGSKAALPIFAFSILDGL